MAVRVQGVQIFEMEVEKTIKGLRITKIRNFKVDCYGMNDSSENLGI